MCLARVLLELGRRVTYVCLVIIFTYLKSYGNKPCRERENPKAAEGLSFPLALWYEGETTGSEVRRAEYKYWFQSYQMYDFGQVSRPPRALTFSDIANC